MDSFKDQFKEHPKTKKVQNACSRFLNFFFRVKDNHTELDCKLEVLDIPYVCSMNSKNYAIGERFFKSLSEVSEYSLFNYRSVQCIIEYRW